MNTSVLSISLDANIARQTYADARDRHLAYAQEFEDFVVVILSTPFDHIPAEDHTQSLHLYATNSFHKIFGIYSAISIITNIYRKYQFQVVTAQDPFLTGFIAWFIHWKYNIPLVLQLHEWFGYNPRPETVIWWQRMLHPWVQWLVRHANAVRVVNKQLANRLEEELGRQAEGDRREESGVMKYELGVRKNSRIHNSPVTHHSSIYHIPMMVDLDFFYKPVQKKKMYVNFVSVGRLVPEKNFGLLVQAFATLAQLESKVTLTLIGEGPERKKIEDTIQKRGILTQVRLLGKLNRQQVKEQLHSHDVFVLSSNHEGWPMVIMEAMSAGLPIISTRVGAVGDLVIPEKTGLVVEVGAEKELTHCMSEYILHPEKAYHYSTEGQRMVLNTFKKETLMHQWIQLLQQTKSR